jgi:hypothetical protein
MLPPRQVRGAAARAAGSVASERRGDASLAAAHVEPLERVAFTLLVDAWRASPQLHRRLLAWIAEPPSSTAVAAAGGAGHSRCPSASPEEAAGSAGRRVAASDGSLSVCPGGGHEAVVSLAAPAAGGGGARLAVRRLFDKEADNHHEEAMLLAQLAARQVLRLLGGDSGSQPAFAALAADWAADLIEVHLDPPCERGVSEPCLNGLDGNKCLVLDRQWWWLTVASGSVFYGHQIWPRARTTRRQLGPFWRWRPRAAAPRWRCGWLQELHSACVLEGGILGEADAATWLGGPLNVPEVFAFVWRRLLGLHATAALAAAAANARPECVVLLREAGAALVAAQQQPLICNMLVSAFAQAIL